MGRKKFKEYGPADVIQAMEAVVAETGEDFVYQKDTYDGMGICRYMHGEEVPGCLIGRVLIHLGAQPRVVWAAEQSYILANGHGIGVEEFLGLLAPTWGTLGYTITPEAVQALTVAQNAQDCANTWGQALKGAKRAVGALA